MSQSNLKNQKIINLLTELYENPKSVSSFSGVSKLYREAKKLIPSITINNVKTFLKGVDSYTLHRLSRKKFVTQKIIAGGPKTIICMDLIDMNKLSAYNNNIKFLMYFIDVFSKKVSVIPLFNKTKNSILYGLKSFFNINDNKKYSRLYSDFESGLYSNIVKLYLKKINISVYSNSSVERKGAVAERNLQTLKKYIFKYLTHNNSFKYIHVLNDIVYSLNNRTHSSLKNNRLTPEILHNITNSFFLREQFFLMFSINKSKHIIHSQSLKINSYVRMTNVSRTQNLFFKSYNISNTPEIFKIYDIEKKRIPYLFKLRDLAGNNILGSFYQAELTPTFLPKIFPIHIISEKIINKNKYYKVSYIGYPDTFNELISEKQILSYK